MRQISKLDVRSSILTERGMKKSRARAQATSREALRTRLFTTPRQNASFCCMPQTQVLKVDMLYSVLDLKRGVGRHTSDLFVFLYTTHMVSNPTVL